MGAPLSGVRRPLVRTLRIEDGGFCLGLCDMIVVLEGDVGFSNDLI